MATVVTRYQTTPTHVMQQQNADSPHPAAHHGMTFKGLGITQIVIGVIALILGIVMYTFLSVDYSGTGVWGGILVTAGLVVTIFASILGFICGIWDGVEAANRSRATTTNRFQEDFSHYVAIHTLLSLCGFAQALLAITVSAFCCMGTCECGQRNSQGQVLGPGPFSHMTTFPVPQHGYGQQSYYEQPIGGHGFTNINAPQQMTPEIPPTYEAIYQKI